MSTSGPIVRPRALPVVPLYFTCCECGQMQFDVQCISCATGNDPHPRCDGCTTYEFWDCCKSKEHEGQFKEHLCRQCNHRRCTRCHDCAFDHMPKWVRRQQERREGKKREQETRDRERRERQSRGWETRELTRKERERRAQEIRERETRGSAQPESVLSRALTEHPSSRARTIENFNGEYHTELSYR